MKNSKHVEIGRYHRLLGAVVLPLEGDLLAVEGEEAAVGDGDAVGVAGEIGEHGLGPSEGALEDRRGGSVGRLPATSRCGMAQTGRGTEVASRA